MKKGDYYRSNEFLCKKHHIYISPSTFSYQNWGDNILWKSENDRRLINLLKESKRDKGKGFRSERSEDAVTWNVFRYLENNNLLETTLTQITGSPQKTAKPYYWGIRPKGGVYKLLEEARETFEQVSSGHRSEPDLIIETEESLFVVEAKILASNNPPPSDPDVVRNKYESNSERWFSKVFRDDFNKIALEKRFYQLMRHWLLGSWMANEINHKFYLINLVLESKEVNIESQFGSLIIESEKMKFKKFKRFTWESIYQIVKKSDSINKSSILNYFEGKTIGYTENKKLQLGSLKRAFNLSDLSAY